MKTEQINKLIVEALQKPKAKSCSCGCGTCSTNDAPILTESKVKNILSEGLQHHIDNKIPLHDTIYRYSSDQHLSLIKEAKKLYSRGIIDLAEGDKQLIETNLGEFGMFEGEAVPLDLPMMNEREDALGIYDDGKGNSAYINRARVGFMADIDGEYDFQIGPAATIEELIKMLAAEGFTNKIFESDINEQGLKKGNSVRFKADPKVIWNILGVQGDTYRINQQGERSISYKPISWLDNMVATGKASVNQNEALKTGTYAGKKVAVHMDGAESDWEVEFENGKKLSYIDLMANLKFDDGTTYMDYLKEYSEYGGREVKLNKPKRGGSKAYYVYVKDPRSKKVKKVQFGSGGLRAKIKDKDARSAYAARHRCSKKKDRTTPGYWSCNLPRYAKALKLGNNMNTFW
ncbi:hypothetical protein N9145_02040 [bacterium]|nr:hypothetical protein [bacterium]